MKQQERTAIVRAVLLLVLCAWLGSCSGADKNNEATTKKGEAGFDAAALLRDRKAKDEEFRSEYSPLPREQWAGFEGLHYYEPTAEYYIPVAWKVLAKPDTVQIAATKSDDIRTMVRYGVFTFSIGGTECKLTAYKNTGETAQRYPTLLFVPFQDKTTGVDTYGAGRYLDLEEPAGEKEYTLDFNRAYNPYCAYNEAYSCPLVPEENILPVAIRAGEKNYGH